MGRELRRVPLDFDWPIGQVWEGFLGPDPADDTPPPSGDGYQMWETVTEGSPCSPVFANAEELATWLSENDDSVTGGSSAEDWLRFINGAGWAPSLGTPPTA